MIDAYRCDRCKATVQIEVIEVDAETGVPLKHGVYGFCDCEDLRYDESLKHQEQAANWAVENIRGLT